MNADKELESEEFFFDNLDDSLLDFYDADSLNDSVTLEEHVTTLTEELSKLPKHYTIIDLVAEGGMKKIFRVRDHKGGRILAMAKTKSRKTEHIEQFLQEARLTALLTHPNIVSIYDIDFDDEHMPFFTMELLRGETFDKVIRRSTSPQKDMKGKLDLDKLLDIFIHICNAVSFAHSMQVIHLDLKPSNIHIGEFGEIYVCDWGLSKVITNSESEFDEELDGNVLNDITLKGRLKGTPGYMAPEQAIENGTKDERTDIFALGSILYTMVTGKIPFKGETVRELLDETRNGNVIPVRNFLPKKNELPRLSMVIMKALAPDPEKRYQSVEDMKNDIVYYRKGYATLAENASFLTQLSLVINRHSTVLSLIAAMVLVVTIVVVFSFVSINDQRWLAVKMQTRAEHNLRLYKDEQRAKQQLSAELASLAQRSKIAVEKENLHTQFLSNNLPYLSTDVTVYDTREKIQGKIAILNKLLNQSSPDKNRKELWKKKGNLHFLLQEFQTAEASFKRVGDDNSKKMIILSLWGQEKKGSFSQLAHRDLAGLISKLDKESSIVMFKLHMQTVDQSKLPADKYLPLALCMLNVINDVPHNRTQEFLPFIRDGKLSLKKSSYHSLIVQMPQPFNILAPLKIAELDISETDFYNFDQLKGLTLSGISIIDCKLQKITPEVILKLKEIGIGEITLDSRKWYGSKVELALFEKNFTCIDGAPSGFFYTIKELLPSD